MRGIFQTTKFNIPELGWGVKYVHPRRLTLQKLVTYPTERGKEHRVLNSALVKGYVSFLEGSLFNIGWMILLREETE